MAPFLGVAHVAYLPQRPHRRPLQDRARGGDLRQAPADAGDADGPDRRCHRGGAAAARRGRADRGRASVHVDARRAPAGRQDHHHALHRRARAGRELPRPLPADGARRPRAEARRPAPRCTERRPCHGLGRPISCSPTRGIARRRSRADSLFQPKFDADGLIPAIVTDAASGEVLMFAWMNAEALALTLETRVGHFWSRSRGKLWKKGEESGNLLDVRRAAHRLRPGRRVAQGDRRRRRRRLPHRRAVLLLPLAAAGQPARRPTIAMRRSLIVLLALSLQSRCTDAHAS